MPSFDYVKISVFQVPNKQEREKLRSLCAGGIRTQKNKSEEALYRWTIFLQQPRPEAFEFLASLEIYKRASPYPRYSISYVELSLDYVGESIAELDKYLRRHLCKGWVRSNKLRHFKSTQYVGKEGRGSELVIYSDRPSKSHKSDRPCVHIEWRASGSQVVKKDAIAIKRFEDFLDFDHRAFWQKHFDLREIDIEKLGRFRDTQHQKRRRRASLIQQWGPVTRNLDQRTGHLLARLATANLANKCDAIARNKNGGTFPVDRFIYKPPHELFSVQVLREEYGTLAANAMSKIDNEPFLPSPLEIHDPGGSAQ